MKKNILLIVILLCASLLAYSIGRAAPAANCSAPAAPGVDWSTCSKSGASLPGVDLTGANLFATDLSNANLSGANLTNVSAFGAAFDWSNLSNANLTGADLRASLGDSDLTGAILTGANLTGANLQNTNLLGATGIVAPHSGIVYGNTTCPNGLIAPAQIPACWDEATPVTLLGLQARGSAPWMLALPLATLFLALAWAVFRRLRAA